MKRLVNIFTIIIISLSGNYLLAQWSQVGADVDGSAYDAFGSSVSLSADGLTLAVGVPGSSILSSHVKIYNYNGSNWVQLGANIEGITADDGTGWSLSLSANGKRVAIGSPYNDNLSIGGTRIFEYDGTNWVQLGNDIVGESFSYSGWIVSLNYDGTIVGIGTTSSIVKVYQYTGSNWAQLGSNITGSTNTNFGIAASIDSTGKIIAVGASKSYGDTTEAGKVFVYKYDGSVWNQLGDDINGGTIYGYAGKSVSINNDGSIVAVGAPGKSGTFNSGATKVYKFDGTTWNQRGNDLDADHLLDKWGSSVSLNGSGDVLAVSAPDHDKDNWAWATNEGYTKVFKYDNTTWNQLGATIDGENTQDKSGNSISISDNGLSIAIGAAENDDAGTKAGHVRTFSYGSLSAVSTIDDAKQQVFLYPNPAKGYINIKGNYNNLIIYNVTGEKILTFTNTKQLELSSLKSGIYFFEIDNQFHRVLKVD